ncbi:MAG TPA: class I SAM-dependent methyltransferase [Terracidiphilus sp.]|nr:class I SAM-dependent methyltransferase [Terracidiphilus sp.]
MTNLLDARSLERSEVIANACMNRERNLTGGNSYGKELRLAPVEHLKKVLTAKEQATWLDLCCGTGRALIQAAETLERLGLSDSVRMVGIDLAPMFVPITPEMRSLRLIAGSVERWKTRDRFDLITCVHGLHYVGDKLGLIQRAAHWLTANGQLMMHLDMHNLKLAQPAARSRFAAGLRRAGFRYLSGRHLLLREGNAEFSPLPYHYIGADDTAGPNFTGQPAVDSYYEPK